MFWNLYLCTELSFLLVFGFFFCIFVAACQSGVWARCFLAKHWWAPRRSCCRSTTWNEHWAASEGDNYQCTDSGLREGEAARGTASHLMHAQDRSSRPSGVCWSRSIRVLTTSLGQGLVLVATLESVEHAPAVFYFFIYFWIDSTRKETVVETNASPVGIHQRLE